MNDQLAESHYRKRLLSSIFGHWMSYLRESICVKDESDKIAGNYLSQKFQSPVWEISEMKNVSKKYFLAKWINFCNGSLRQRGQNLLGKIAREKILIAKGYQKFRQFFIDEKLLLSHGILPLQSSLQYDRSVFKFQEYLQQKQKRKFLRLLYLKYQEKMNCIRRLCSPSCSLMRGPAREAIRRWLVRSRKADRQMLALRKAMRHHFWAMKNKGFIYLRNNSKRNQPWQQLYNFCDTCHNRYRMKNQGIQIFFERFRRNRSYNIPRMYRALSYWKNKQGRNIFHAWRAYISDKVFRSRSNRKLDDFYNRKRLKSSIGLLKEFVIFRKETRKYNAIIAEESSPQKAFYSKLRALLCWQSRLRDIQRQRRAESLATKRSRKVTFHKFIYRKMNEIYFPVVLRRQAAFWRRACFHDGARKLFLSFSSWKNRLTNAISTAFITQRERLIDALFHWKRMKLRQGLRLWFHFSRKRTAFRFIRRQALLQAQPSFQRQRLLSRYFHIWRESILKILRMKREKIRQQYHLSPKRQIEAQIETVSHELLPPISAEVKLLKEQVKGVLARPMNVYVAKTMENAEKLDTDLARAAPKPLAACFPSIPADLKYGMVAAASSSCNPYQWTSSNPLLHDIPTNADHCANLPPWVMSLSVASSVSSIASSHHQNHQNSERGPSILPSHHEQASFMDHKPHWSEYIHRELPQVQGQPVPDHIAKALKIFNLPPPMNNITPSKGNLRGGQDDHQLAREPPRDGNYRPQNSFNPAVQSHHLLTSQLGPESCMSTVSVSSNLSSILPTNASTHDAAIPITTEYVHRFLTKIQHIDPIKFKAMLKKYPEKRRIFVEIRETLRLMYVEELRLAQTSA